MAIFHALVLVFFLLTVSMLAPRVWTIALFLYTGRVAAGKWEAVHRGLSREMLGCETVDDETAFFAGGGGELLTGMMCNCIKVIFLKYVLNWGQVFWAPGCWFIHSFKPFAFKGAGVFMTQDGGKVRTCVCAYTEILLGDLTFSWNNCLPNRTTPLILHFLVLP